MNFFGKAIIFRNEVNGNTFYKTSISNTDQAGNRIYMPIDVQLPKGAELHNKTMINVTKGFESFWTDKDGGQHVKYVIQEFQEEQQKPQVNVADFSEAAGEDLPF